MLDEVSTAAEESSAVVALRAFKMFVVSAFVAGQEFFVAQSAVEQLG